MYISDGFAFHLLHKDNACFLVGTDTFNDINKLSFSNACKSTRKELSLLIV